MVGASFEPIPLTEAQNRTLEELSLKAKRTDNQENTYRSLLEKKFLVPEPTLSTGAKTYIEELWHEDKYQFRKNFTNKFVQKGNSIEGHSLAELSKFLGVKCFKNIKHFENDFIMGTPDSLLKQFKMTIDAKNVYYPDGLNLFSEDKESNLYTWQIHGYNYLLEHDKGIVIRMLMNPPVDIIEKEVWTAWKGINHNPDEYPTDEFRTKIFKNFDFESKLPFEDRMNFTKIDSTQDHFILIEKMVELARVYYAELDEKFAERKTLILN